MASRSSFWTRWALAASLLALAPRAALAEPSAADKETARSLLNEGDKKRDAKDLRGALLAYQAADAIMGVPTTGIEVAKTEERLGLLVEARDAALRVVRLPAAPSEPRAFQQARAAAERLAADLSARVPSVRVVVRGAPAEEITLLIDDAAIPKAAAGLPRKVNPGKHVVVAYGDGYERASTELVIEERENRDCELTLVPSKEARASAQRAPAPPDDRARASFVPPIPKEEAEPPARPSPLLWVGASLAGAGLVVGTVAGIAELGKAASARTDCRPGGPRDTCIAELDSAHRFATISNVSLGVGALGAAVGIFTLMRGTSKSPSAAIPSNLLLVVEPSAASVIGVF